MKVLVVGSGAREHALCRALRRDPAVDALVCAPGNAGTATLADTRPLDVAAPAAVVGLAAEAAVDLVVIGPEVPLVNGAADACRAAGIATFGPSAAAITSLAKDLEPSICAAAAGVPKVAIPAARPASAAPLTSGTSGPITTRSTAAFAARPTTAAGAATSSGRVSARVAVPALPGAQTSASTAGSRRSARQSACSRAPEPTTRTFMTPPR